MRQFKTTVDRLLASVSMYLLITLALFVLFGVAFTLSLLGLLSFQPLALVVYLALFMGICFGSSYLFAYLFSVTTAHHKSALITGGILFFLFTPVISVPNLLLYSIIAVIAIASKYLLVWKGRHMFNPAAVAAVIVSLTGLQFASWWGASLPLAIPATLLGVLILYKTQRLQFASIFLITYVVTVVINATLAGLPIMSTLVQTLATWWPLFFAGFMLSEPLTLASRRYQYFIEAAFVAVLIGFHPSIGTLYLTPEIALIAGNILSFIFTRQVGVSLKLVKRLQAPGDQEVFEFETNRPLRFKPGQYMEVTLPHSKADLRGERRMFTIASAPESRSVKLATRYAQNSSSFKKALRAMKKGDIFPIVAIRGDFLLPKDASEKLLFIAGGIGITPFRSHIESLQMRKEKRDIVLIHAIRSKDQAIFEDVLDAQNSARIVRVAPDAPSKSTKMVRAQVVDEELLKNVVKDIRDRKVYISGPPQMVDAIRRAAQNLGVKHIKTDDFTGY